MNYMGIKEKFKQMAPTRIIIFSFILVILIGTAILSMPFSSKGEPIHVLDALFTATSATCVTGLSLFDTYNSFTFIGQFTILLLIQVGGLGLATFATAVTLFLRKKLGYKNLLIFSEISGKSSLDLTSLLKAIIIITFSCELIGASLLMIRFVPEYGALGAWASVFVAVSAFCNAGFDVLGFIPNNSSVSAFAGDPLVSFTICALIFMGSLGFLVIQDILITKCYSRLKRKTPARLSFHSQICLRVSVILILLGAVFIFILEFDNTMAHLNFFEKIIASIFQSVNTRTAGFASVNLSAENELTKVITIMLMFIGGSPGSTAGGIKITTFIVIVATISSTIRGREDVACLSHRFDKKIVYKAITIMFLGLAIIFIDTILLVYFNRTGSTLDALFESTSAFATVGLSTGVTSHLNLFSKIIIIITMFIGRVGPATFGIAIMIKPKKGGNMILPEGRMLIG